MSKHKSRKQHKLRRVLYLLGYRDYMNAHSSGPFLAVLTNKEQKAYRKGQNAARRSRLKAHKIRLGLDTR